MRPVGLARTPGLFTTTFPDTTRRISIKVLRHPHPSVGASTSHAFIRLQLNPRLQKPSSNMVSIKAFTCILAAMEAITSGISSAAGRPTANIQAGQQSQSHYEADSYFGKRALQTDGCQTVPVTVQATTRNKRQAGVVSSCCRTCFASPIVDLI